MFFRIDGKIKQIYVGEIESLISVADGVIAKYENQIIHISTTDFTATTL